MKKQINRVFVALAVAAILPGCASIVSQSSWPVAIQSNPDQAKFTITNEKGTVVHSGTTPETVTLSSGAGYFDGETYKITFSHEGREDVTATLNSSINGWYFGNFLFGGLIGLLIVDPNTGAMWKLPEKVQQELMLNKASKLDGNQDTFSLISIDEIPKQHRGQLIRLN